MKTKPCIFVFFLCELILIFVVAIKSSIDEKQSKEYKTKIEVDMDECWRGTGEGGYWGREHGDVDMGGWLGRGTPRRRGMGGSGEEVNESPGGKGGGGHKGGSGGSEKEGPGGEGGGEHKGGSGGSEKGGPGGEGGGGHKGPGEKKGSGGEGGGIENGDHLEHP